MIIITGDKVIFNEIHALQHGEEEITRAVKGEIKTISSIESDKYWFDDML